MADLDFRDIDCLTADNIPVIDGERMTPRSALAITYDSEVNASDDIDYSLCGPVEAEPTDKSSRIDTDQTTGTNAAPLMPTKYRSTADEMVFLTSLATRHSTTPDKLSYRIEGRWKFYLLDKKILWKESA